MAGHTKVKTQNDGSLTAVEIAIPVFGYKNHIVVNRASGPIRKWAATNEALITALVLRRFWIGPIRLVFLGGYCRSVDEERGDACVSRVRLQH